MCVRLIELQPGMCNGRLLVSPMFLLPIQAEGLAVSSSALNRCASVVPSSISPFSLMVTILTFVSLQTSGLWPLDPRTHFATDNNLWDPYGLAIDQGRTVHQNLWNKIPGSSWSCLKFGWVKTHLPKSPHAYLLIYLTQSHIELDGACKRELELWFVTESVLRSTPDIFTSRRHVIQLLVPLR